MEEPGWESEGAVGWLRLRAYPRVALAREAALALAAAEIEHRIDRRGEEWFLSVAAGDERSAAAELEAFEAEQREQANPAPGDSRAAVPFHPWSLLVAGSALAGAFLAQDRFGPAMLAMGTAESDAIYRRGEWWRCWTALFLHADLAHLLANLAFGLLFAAFLFTPYGAGVAWLLILFAGAAGNALNAWGYRGEAHFSIGASTGVFAALGLLAGSELYARWALPETRTRRHLLGPLGGGLALLAFLGVGEKHESIDFMAHAWGFLAGLLLAWPAAWMTLRATPRRWVQFVAGSAALALSVWAWKLAAGAGPG